jgi:hypothetical protein
MDEPSRIEQARARLQGARVATAGAALVAFAVFAMAARASHPASASGSSQASNGATTSSVTSDDQSYSPFYFGSGSVGQSSGSSPSIQSSAS